MKALLGAGFVFWGLFLTFGLLVLFYVIWMWRVERKESGRDTRPDGMSGS